MKSDLTKYTQDTINIWFPNQKEPLYDPNNPEVLSYFITYWKIEKERCISGFYIGNVFISGWLYWHTVYYKIAMYVENPVTKKKYRKISTPLFRDIEWIIANDFVECETLGRFYALVGSRDFGKSIIAASRAAYLYTFFERSEVVVSSGAASYIKLVTDKIEDGLLNVHPMFKKQRLINDWKKEVLAGFKDKSTGLPSDKSSFSSIKVRNYEDGNNTMAANGTRPGFHLMDEIGTMRNLIGCIKDSDGCWWSGDGDKPSCLTMYAGTGGDMEVGADAAEVFFKPDAYNILSFTNDYEPGSVSKIGRFIPATMAKMAYKEKISLADYLGTDKEDRAYNDLSKITILNSNKDRALKEWWEPQYEKALKTGNPKAILKFKAYWPLKPSDSFIRLTSNDFNVDAAKLQKNKLMSLGRVGTPVELYHDGNKLTHKFTDKFPIMEYPANENLSKDAPIVIYEFPVENPPFGLYVAGIDPYRQSGEGGESLGVVYIFKLMHDIQSERYQWMFVASYAARPKDIDTWHENARNLLKYYNAYGLCENDEMSFINYMIYKGDGHYLADTPGWLREIMPNSKTLSRKKGISRSPIRSREYLDGIFKKFMDEVIYVEKDEEGKTLREVIGISRILDPMLLEEIIRYDKDGNFDRVIAAECALALAEHMTPQIRVSDTGINDRTAALYANKNKRSSILDYSKSNSFVKGNKGKTLKVFL
jgi:hypothetical protein